MTGFKIGDKVKVLTNPKNSAYWHSLKEGSVGTVVDIDEDSLEDYAVEAQETWTGRVIEQWLHFSELELVNE